MAQIELTSQDYCAVIALTGIHNEPNVSWGRVNGEKNSSVTRVWPVILELLRGTAGRNCIQLISEVAFKNSGNVLADGISRTAGPIDRELIETPREPRSIYGLNVKLPQLFEYPIPATERFLLWMIEHTGEGCEARPAFQRALRAQMQDFERNAPPAA